MVGKMIDLKVKLLNHLTTYHRGMKRAITRERLLGYLQGIGYEIDDRGLRKAVKDLKCIAACSTGYFIPIARYEADHYIDYLKAKIFPLWEDIKNIRQAYPEFYNKDEQFDLFEE